jgi:hypothetical protein
VTWSNVLGPRDLLDLAREARDARFFALVVLNQNLPSFSYRHGLRRALLAALEGRPGSRLLENLTNLRNYNRNKGAYVKGKNPEFHGQVATMCKRALLGDHWACDPLKARYVSRFLGLAAANGIRVYWLIPPFSPALQAGRERTGRDADYTRFVQSFRRYPNLVVLDGRYSGYDDSAFLDSCHIDSDGAYAYSKDVADAVRRPVGPRRVALPAYRKQPIDVPVETSHESVAAVSRLLAGDVTRR